MNRTQGILSIIFISIISNACTADKTNTADFEEQISDNDDENSEESTEFDLSQIDACEGPTGGNGLVPGSCNKTWFCDIGDITVSCQSDSGESDDGAYTCSCMWGREVSHEVRINDGCSALYSFTDEPAYNQYQEILNACGFLDMEEPRSDDTIYLGELAETEEQNENISEDNICEVENSAFPEHLKTECMQSNCCSEMQDCREEGGCTALFWCIEQCPQSDDYELLICADQCAQTYPAELPIAESLGDCRANYCADEIGINRDESNDDSQSNDAEVCLNTCRYAGDGECDDGGPGAAYAGCTLGTDCEDCGVRIGQPPELTCGFEQIPYDKWDTTCMQDACCAELQYCANNVSCVSYMSCKDACDSAPYGRPRDACLEGCRSRDEEGYQIYEETDSCRVYADCY